MMDWVQHDRRQPGVSKPPPAKGKATRSKHQRQPEGVRVVYIASPMKLTASPEEFRAVVQELTGRHSNIAERQYVDSVHPPPTPPRPACANHNIVTSAATAAPPPSAISAAVLPVPTPPLPQQIFQSSYDHGGEHEQAAGLCYGGQGYYW
ncbi:hypothetical protein E2562_018405 [Oryza meyeriana var. granulata]|uniref:VQ domain-containing protein n=1 Tax=Oryza meyeriana var. granulata TaxID=110450 RepID=A0A6G1D5B8_9ORYZ|nr:hypothetical protein E2562_018405 [Oryza meyeriana var. granulata]